MVTSGKVAVVLSSYPEGTMPYATGETPEVGDYVKNKYEQPGTVTKVQVVHGEDRIRVMWDDGGIELPFASATEFTLISRQLLPGNLEPT